MARIDPTDPQLVERIRSLLGQGYEPGSAQPSWVPDPPPRTPGPRVLTVPSFVRDTRRRVGRRALAALVGAALAAAVPFAVRVQFAARDGEPVAVAPAGSGLVSRSLPPGFTAAGLAGTAGGSAAAGAATDGPASASAGGGGPPTIVVHVVGEVARPGIVVLPSGNRISDAVASAGGALASADLERLNLARVLADGEQIHVPAPGEVLLPGSNGAPAAGGPGSGGASPTGTAPAPIDLNTADLAALDTLPGVGPVLAQRILQWRSQHGRFSTVEELNEVSGIGDKLFAELRTRVTV
jgi:comEA protein